MFARTIKGFRTYASSLGFIGKHSLLGQAVLPAIVGLGVGVLLIAAVVFASGDLAQAAFANLDARFNLPDFLGKVLRVLMVLTGIFLVVIVYRPVASIVVIPFIGPILARVETILIGREITTSFTADFRSALLGGWLGLLASFFGFFIFMITIPLGPGQPFIMFFVNAYILGKSGFDFVFEKESDTMEERRELNRKYRWEILGVGIGFLITLLIPIIGIAIAPVLAVVAAARIRYQAEER
ncbi:MAG: EI24 domain-containing protein [Leptospirales bacterium]|nr:EI24 domain-containing protein [Leptospirales bacterium]